MKIKIYGSGSDGNSIQIDDILIDAGITRKRMEEVGFNEDEVSALIITHRHADHMNESFVKKWITSGYTCILSEDAIEKLESKYRFERPLITLDNVHTHPFNGIIGSKWITTIPQKHYDLVNYAVYIKDHEKSALYATDLDTVIPTNMGKGLLHIPPVDYLLLEGNYDEHWLLEVITNAIEIIDPELDVISLTPDELDTWVRSNYQNIPDTMRATLFRAVQNRRHLSKQQARAYAAKHVKPNGVYYEIHRSKKFYERPNIWD